MSRRPQALSTLILVLSFFFNESSCKISAPKHLQWNRNRNQIQPARRREGGNQRIPMQNGFWHAQNLNIEAPRRGSITKRVTQSKVSTTYNRSLKFVIGVALGISLSFSIWENRSTLERVFDKQKLQDSILNVLKQIKDKGVVKGLVFYTGGMAVWELLGISTVALETAAGMAFGYHKAFLASSIGKLLGALCAFWMGRLWLTNSVRNMLRDNNVMQMVDGSVQQNPLKTALLFKFSVFPEAMKNFGTSVLAPIEPWMFVLSFLVHTIPYSALWTYLGVDTVSRMQNESLKQDRLLQGLLVMAGLMGFVGSPSIMAWWIRDLKMQSDKIKRQK